MDPTEQTELLTSRGSIGAVKKCLYTSHFLSTWNSRVFEYGAVLFLAQIYDESFAQLSLYALFRSLSAILLSHKVGEYIDGAERLPAVRHSIVYQRISVIISCVLIGVMILAKEGSLPSWLELQPHLVIGISLGGLIFFACIERLCAIMNLLVIERD